MSGLSGNMMAKKGKLKSKMRGALERRASVSAAVPASSRVTSTQTRKKYGSEYAASQKLPENPTKGWKPGDPDPSPEAVTKYTKALGSRQTKNMALIRQRYGDDKSWQKRIYGKNYKPGTLKNLQSKLKDQRFNLKKSNEKLSNLTSALSSTTDESQKAALQKRLDTLNKNRETIKSNTSSTKKSTDKYLSKRSAMLKNLYITSKAKPGALEAARKRQAMAKIAAARNKPMKGKLKK